MTHGVRRRILGQRAGPHTSKSLAPPLFPRIVTMLNGFILNERLGSQKLLTTPDK